MFGERAEVAVVSRVRNVARRAGAAGGDAARGIPAENAVASGEMRLLMNCEQLNETLIAYLDIKATAV